MAFSRLTKLALVSMMTSQELADEVENRLFTDAPASAGAAAIDLQSLNYDGPTQQELANRLSWSMAGSGSEGASLAQKVNGMVSVLRAKANGDEISEVNAEATLDLTADITLTDDSGSGAARNTETFTLEVEAAAANPTDTILADFTGTASAIILTITPNDGTNNGAVAVDLTTAELAELINSGAVAGKTVTVTDGSSLRALQTASGGDATNLADGGEGDSEVATFAGGVTSADTDIADAKSAMGSDYMSDEVFDVLISAITSQAAAEEFRDAFNAMVDAMQSVS